MAGPLESFNPSNNSTVSAAVLTTAVEISTTSQNSASQRYRIANVGANVVYITIGATYTAATTAGIPLLPNSVEYMAGPVSAYISAISAATGNTLFVTPGY